MILSFTSNSSSSIANKDLPPGGGGRTSLYEANGDMPLDLVAFSIELLEWGRTFSDV